MSSKENETKLTEKYMVDTNERELRAKYFLITDADLKNLKKLKDAIHPKLDIISDAFYGHVFNFEGTKKFFPEEGIIDRLKLTLQRNIRQMLDSDLSDDYFETRLTIGAVHERINLDPKWYLGAYNLMMTTMHEIIIDYFSKEKKMSIKQIYNMLSSLNKICFMDMTLVLDSYFGENLFRVDQQRLTLQTLIKETTTSVTEVKQTSELVSDNARVVSETSSESAEIAEGGRNAVFDSVEGVNKIKEQIESIAEKILELSEQTQTIGKIITTVDDIAKQSKLLAFNAAIEASKAGEAGKGFSVVATEIKNLSEESKEATNKIADILSDIQKATNAAVMMTEDGTKLAEKGVSLAQKAGESIDLLTDSIKNSSEAALQILSSAQEQKVGMEQLEQAMKNISFSG